MTAVENGGLTRGLVFKQWGRIVGGLIIAAMGVYMQIYANIGLAPWDCLGMGIAKHTPLNYGMAMTVTALIILGIDLLMKERIGFGTIIDALISGNLAQLYSDLNPLPEVMNTWAGIGIMLGGFVIQSIGMWLYMSAAQCCGPRDALFVALGKRVPKIPVGFVQIVVWAVVLLVGWLLGGPVGIGTVISTFGMGLMLQLVFNIVHFEPRKVQHRSVIEVVRVLIGR